MKKTLIAALATVGALTAVAAPAAAQPYRHDHGRDYDRGVSDTRHLGRLALHRVDVAIERGQLDRREARRLRAQAFDLYQYESRTGGDDWRERQVIRERYSRIMAQLDRDVRDRDYGYGYYR
jgi:hypothetical protein